MGIQQFALPVLYSSRKGETVHPDGLWVSSREWILSGNGLYEQKADCPGRCALIDVLGEPAETFAIALPLQNTAHEHLQWPGVQLLHGDVTLATSKASHYY